MTPSTAPTRGACSTLIRLLGDFDRAEEAMHDAVAAAMELVRQEPERRFLERRLRELPTYPPPLA